MLPPVLGNSMEADKKLSSSLGNGQGEPKVPKAGQAAAGLGMGVEAGHHRMGWLGGSRWAWEPAVPRWGTLVLGCLASLVPCCPSLALTRLLYALTNCWGTHCSVSSAWEPSSTRETLTPQKVETKSPFSGAGHEGNQVVLPPKT